MAKKPKRRGRESDPRYFCVRNPKGKVMKDTYTSSKAEAKSWRADFNGVDEDSHEILDTGYRIARGPDHHRGAS